MIVADLHVHTTVSDGTMTLSDARDAARAADLDAVAITDHDAVHPALDVPVTQVDSGDVPTGENSSDGEEGVEKRNRYWDRGTDGDDELTVIRGIELRVDAGFEAIDLLGYAVRETPALGRELDRLGRNRAERGRRIVERVEDRLGVELDLVIDDGVGRPHVARAIADSDADYGYREAFEQLIGDERPCYVPRELPAFDDGVSLLADACEVVSLAHPFRYRDTERALGLCADRDIDAVERQYPYGRPVNEALVERAIDEHALLETGGSDAHDDELGRAGLSPTEYEPLAKRLSRP